MLVAEDGRQAVDLYRQNLGTVDAGAARPAHATFCRAKQRRAELAQHLLDPTVRVLLLSGQATDDVPEEQPAPHRPRRPHQALPGPTNSSALRPRRPRVMFNHEERQGQKYQYVQLHEIHEIYEKRQRRAQKSRTMNQERSLGLQG